MRTLTRQKASLLHFGLSLALFSIIFFVLLTLWYPEPYFSASGGWQGLKIVASVDIVLGPLLTFVVFNPLKSRRELTTDLGVIFSLQFAALLWGIHTVYQQRPVAAVFYDGSFLTVAAVDLTSQNYPLENLQQYSDEKPALIYSEKPRTKEGILKLLENLEKHGIAPHHQTDLYRPLYPNFPQVFNLQLKFDQENKRNPTLDGQLTQLLQNKPYKKNELEFFLLQSKYKNMLLVFSSKGDFVGYLDR